jgi:NAD(P)-dependent dehydrogenase (short-subunit alcohol dehydrogenase family)
MKSILITGASTGIGEDAARLLTQHGFRVFGSVRKPADAERLRQTWERRLLPCSSTSPTKGQSTPRRSKSARCWAAKKMHWLIAIYHLRF